MMTGMNEFVDVSDKMQRGAIPFAAWKSSVADDAEPQADTRLESKAARMHMLGRLRGQHFFTPVMADTAMDVMLSLFVGELQSSPVSDTALAVGNLLTREETDAMIGTLVQAGLAVVTGIEPDRRTVGLTPLGSARMRSFVSDYPDV